jgi:hypothetical protein
MPLASIQRDSLAARSRRNKAVMRLVVYGAISRAAGTSPRHIERATSMSLDDRDWYRKEIARRGRLPRSQQTKARVAGAIRLAGLLALPLAFGAPAIGHWLRPEALYAGRRLMPS